MKNTIIYNSIKDKMKRGFALMRIKSNSVNEESQWVRHHKEGFTLIELIVIMAVIAILVLLATPNFINKTQTAKTSQIINDIKVLEAKVDEYLINHDTLDDWATATLGEGQLYDRSGKIDTPPDILKVVDGTFYPETSLDGRFYTDDKGDAIYESNVSVSITENIIDVEKLIAEGWIPVATPDELNQIRQNGTTLTFGSGTKWEGQYLAGLDKSYIQVADIDLTSFGASYRSGKGWAPIGKYYDDISLNVAFTGKYNGANYFIENLYINESAYSDGSLGLWGYAVDASLSNIIIKDSIVTGIGYDDTGGVGVLVGVLYGENNLSELLNIEIINSTVSSESYVGVVAGEISKNVNAEGIKVANSTVNANSVWAWGAGLFAGYVNSGENNCYKNIKIQGIINVTATSQASSIGGYIGDLSGENISHSDIDVDVVINNLGGLKLSQVGGFAGAMIDSQNLNNIKVSGTVSGLNDVGGLVGKIYSNGTKPDTIIKNVDVNVATTGNANVGGLAGKIIVQYESKGSIIFENTSVNGNIQGAKEVGGFIGIVLIEYDNSEGEVILRNSTVNGNIIGTTNINQFIGYQQVTAISSKYIVIDSCIINGDIIK